MKKDKLQATLYEAQLPADGSLRDKRAATAAMAAFANEATAWLTDKAPALSALDLDLDGACIDVRLRGGTLFRIGLSKEEHDDGDQDD